MHDDEDLTEVYVSAGLVRRIVQAVQAAADDTDSEEKDSVQRTIAEMRTRGILVLTNEERRAILISISDAVQSVLESNNLSNSDDDWLAVRSHALLDISLHVAEGVSRAGLKQLAIAAYRAALAELADGRDEQVLETLAIEIGEEFMRRMT